MQHRVLVGLFTAALPWLPFLEPGRVAAPGLPQSARGRFIVAFELRADGPEFVWPLDTFPPSRREAVLLVVEEMPRVHTSDGPGVRPLSAPRHLQINGRLQQPRRAPAARGSAPAAIEEEFVVKLHEGRLRLSVALPVGSRPDAQHRSARVALYEVEPVGSRRD